MFPTRTAARIHRYERSSPVDRYGNAFAFIGDHTLMCLDKSLLIGAAIEGIDYEGLPPSEMHRLTETFATDIADIDTTTFCNYQWLDRHKIALENEAHSPDPIYDHMARKRHEHLVAKGMNLFANDVYFAFQFGYTREKSQGLLHAIPARIEQCIASLRGGSFHRDFAEILRSVVGIVTPEVSISHLQSYLDTTLFPAYENFHKSCAYLRPRLLTKDELYRALFRIHNLDPVKRRRAKLTHQTYMNYFLEQSDVQLVDVGVTVDNKYLVSFMELKCTKRNTLYHMLEGFQSVPFEVIVQTQWERIPDEEQEMRIKLKRNEWSSTSLSLRANKETPQKKDAWADHVDNQMDQALSVLKVDNGHYGWFSLSVMYWAEAETSLENPEERRCAYKTLNDRRDALLQVFHGMDADSQDERLAQKYGWWNMLPLHHLQHDYRRLQLTDKNYADYGMIFALNRGEDRNDYYGGPALLTVSTRSDEPFYLNVNVRDRLDFCMLGAKGSGKSFLAKALILAYRRYGPYWFWLHTLGTDYLDLCRLLGGSYISFDLAGRHPLNLYSLEEIPSHEYLQTIQSIWKELFRAVEYVPNENEWKIFTSALKLLLRQPIARRTNRHLEMMLPTALKGRVAHFVGADPLTGRTPGQYGALFDGSPTDPTTLTDLTRFVVFDYLGLPKNLPSLSRAIMTFVFYLQGRKIYNPDLAAENKFVWTDELSSIVESPDTEIYKNLKGLVNRGRHHRVSVGGILQSLQDLRDCGLLDIFRGGALTWFFLPNAGIDDAQYTANIPFLTEQDTKLIRTMRPKREFLLKRATGMSKVLRLVVDPWTELLFDSNPDVIHHKMELYKQYGFPQSLDIALERIKKGQLQFHQEETPKATPHKAQAHDTGIPNTAPTLAPAPIVPAPATSHQPIHPPAAEAANTLTLLLPPTPQEEEDPDATNDVVSLPRRLTKAI